MIDTYASEKRRQTWKACSELHRGNREKRKAKTRWTLIDDTQELIVKSLYISPLCIRVIGREK